MSGILGDLRITVVIVSIPRVAVTVRVRVYVVMMSSFLEPLFETEQVGEDDETFGSLVDVLFVAICHFLS